MPQSVMVDGNEAAASVAHRLSEVIAIYPITPASPMGEFADAWTAAGQRNIFGSVPDVIEMQSEAGAAGAVHGALQAGALTTTFTASQGLLLMIPNMFKIAGELTSCVMHVAARTVATHALSIFGDHSDVMAVRSTGWAMLCAASVQEAHDFALISQTATLEARVPFLHFFDGFRTSHEINLIDELDDADLWAMTDLPLIQAHRERALNPDHPLLRGTAQNPDVFFQAREACNSFYSAVPDIVQKAMDRFAARTGRQYRLFEYVGAPDAERVIVLMGSGAGAVEEAVAALNAQGEKVGLVKVRLFRPFDVSRFIESLPHTVRHIAVLDRTKEPGAIGEPLYQDILTALVESGRTANVTGGRYGLSSKEFTPAMVAAVFANAGAAKPKKHFTIGIVDDVTHTSLPWDADQFPEARDVHRAVFYGLGSDGTVGANKNSVKIVSENTALHAQGYFVYDSKKSGAVTVSHLRFSPRPIQSTYLIHKANFVACHQFQFLETRDVLDVAEPGAIVLLNAPYGREELWDRLPIEVQQQIIDKELKLYVVDAYRLASELGLGQRINTVMQACFFALTDIVPKAEALGHIRSAIEKTYGKRGDSVVEKNFEAVDRAVGALHQVEVPATATSSLSRRPIVPDNSPDFVKRVTSLILAGLGDRLPVSALPVDGTFVTGTSRYEKRGIAQTIPIWDPNVCIQCGLCSLLCPHAAIRSKAFPEAACQSNAPDSFQTLAWSGKDLPDYRMAIQVAPDDCTGCGVCVDVCPARNKEIASRKAINMLPRLEHLDRERANWDYFLSMPEVDRAALKPDQLNASQLMLPLFEFSGACAGCGETPYIKLLTQYFGDRTIIANATGCSSIFGGNLPTTPYCTDASGRGPAWANSLFEDNAEFGLGMRLAADAQQHLAQRLLRENAEVIGADFVTAILSADQSHEAGIATLRQHVAALKQRLHQVSFPNSAMLSSVVESLVRRSVWIVGGDGWAYDIGFGGLDHVLASNHNVNILVLDTEVYSNTGGQASKATPRAAIAKFAAGGKAVRRKDLGMIAVDYGHVYVAQVAIGANPQQTIKAFLEAESYPGPSLISPSVRASRMALICQSR